jgi:hypothetical protein
MRIDRRDDGSQVMSARAQVRVSYLVYRYAYCYEGTEEWQGGRLLRLTSASNDDGKAFTVKAWADGEGLRVQVNQVERTVPGNLWTTTYWQLTHSRASEQTIALLDADTGRNLTAVLQYAGTEQLKLGSLLVNCTHYRVRGDGLHVDLWYDGQERMVRQESLENGKHRTVIELVQLGRQAP